MVYFLLFLVLICWMAHFMSVAERSNKPKPSFSVFGPYMSSHLKTRQANSSLPGPNRLVWKRLKKNTSAINVSLNFRWSGLNLILSCKQKGNAGLVSLQWVVLWHKGQNIQMQSDTPSFTWQFGRAESSDHLHAPQRNAPIGLLLAFTAFPQSPLIFFLSAALEEVIFFIQPCPFSFANLQSSVPIPHKSIKMTRTLNNQRNNSSNLQISLLQRSSPTSVWSLYRNINTITEAIQLKKWWITPPPTAAFTCRFLNAVSWVKQNGELAKIIVFNWNEEKNPLWVKSTLSC